LLGVIPQDEAVYEYDCDGKPTIELPKDSAVRKALYDILDKMNF
jgi:CO dehydrogenase maturation factor